MAKVICREEVEEEEESENNDNREQKRARKGKREGNSAQLRVDRSSFAPI